MLQIITQITQSQYLDINKLLNGCRQSEYSDIRYIIIKYLVDENGNIVSHEELFQAFKDIIKAKPLVIANIKFNDKDIEAIQEIFESKL